MRYFEEYCEIHLEPSNAPFTWVFRSDEKICVRFGVSLSKCPERGQIAYELNDGEGYWDTGRITAHTEGVVENGFKMFSAILPLIRSGGEYRYSLGYIDSLGKEHTSQQSRFVFVCDEAPRSMAEIKSAFLGFVDNQPLYGPSPSVEMTPSPEDWNARLFYSIIIDRFARSSDNKQRGISAVSYDPSSPCASHGGTIRGILEKIEYLKSLGVRALILSPVYVNASDGYHGYHPIHLLMVDPRLGNLKHLQELVAKAHEANIAVILDVVNNHIADSINWEQYGGPPGGEFKYLQGDGDIVMPFPLEARNTSLFHGPEYTDLVNQRLFGFLEDWRTETSYVRELLVQHLKYWISVTDIDGFRYDSARHVGLDFWEPCIQEVSRYAAYLGKRQFLQIAEHAGSTHEELIAYNSAKFSNLIDYPTYYTIKHSFTDKSWQGVLVEYFCGLLAPSHPYHAGWKNNMMFLDNQDTTRIFHELSSRLSNKDEARVHLHFALACSILGPQIPFIYQGTEQEFCGALGMHQDEDTGEWLGHDYYVREDMFDNPGCVWKFGPINQKSFEPYSTDHATFLLVRQLAEIRFQNRLLQSGTRTLLCSRKNGLWCVLIHDPTIDQPLLVAMNVGATSVYEKYFKIPSWYGEFCGANLLLATSPGAFHVVEGGIQVRLSPFSFVLGQLCRVGC
ncbi:MAG: alpha-amylase family glycosyl hydrolase [Scytonema sp. PMC 1069.18]|nr:alpha-amylase family glycosyl hydrolase [Scytonema sp. PMC 1069.18]MEC4885349.1 alpha-amylase family glycosyl hydrolase [Scytonema sp. PMC 1070.18]